MSVCGCLERWDRRFFPELSVELGLASLALCLGDFGAWERRVGLWFFDVFLFVGQLVAVEVRRDGPTSACATQSSSHASGTAVLVLMVCSVVGLHRRRCVMLSVVLELQRVWLFERCHHRGGRSSVKATRKERGQDLEGATHTGKAALVWAREPRNQGGDQL